MREYVQDLSGFIPVYIIAQFAGIVSVILTAIWTGHFLGGFAWQSKPSLQFNWHPLLMMVGLIYLYGNGILLYRILRNVESRFKLKICHATLMISVFTLTVIALIAVFEFHNRRNIPNMYSLHSWLGILTVILFLFQWLAGFLTYFRLLGGIKLYLRAGYHGFHVFFGLVIFICACATALLGLTEKAIFYGKYNEFHPCGVVANCIGVSTLVFAILVVYLVANPRYKRLTEVEVDKYRWGQEMSELEIAEENNKPST